MLSRDSFRPARRRGPQASFDKQYVRDFLETVDWDKKYPAPPLPPEVVEGTQKRYVEAFRRLVGREIQLP